MTKTKEDLEKEWNTCRHCGITKEDIQKLKEETGKYQSNYVINGSCSVCNEKREKEYDFAEAKREGSITRDDSIMCPYCGYVLEYDTFEYKDDDSFTCPECDKESKLDIEYTAHFTTTKIEDEGQK